MENQSWLKKFVCCLGFGYVVNFCFIVVLFFFILFIWCEVVVLEDVYIFSQCNYLENVVNVFDKYLQYNVDKLIFLCNGMCEVFVALLDFIFLCDVVIEFEQYCDEYVWKIEFN